MATEPSPAADWTVEPAAGGRLHARRRRPTRRSRSHVTFAPATGCADYPEAELDATGTPAKGKTAVRHRVGLVEGHMHWMTLRVLRRQLPLRAAVGPVRHPVRAARLRGVEGPQGTAASFQNFLNYGNPAQAHDTRGYPTMAETWPPAT